MDFTVVAKPFYLWTQEENKCNNMLLYAELENGQTRIESKWHRHRISNNKMRVAITSIIF